MIRKIFKWIGIVLGSLIGLLVVAFVVLVIVGGARANKKYDIPVETVAVPSGAEAIQRGDAPDEWERNSGGPGPPRRGSAEASPSPRIPYHRIRRVVVGVITTALPRATSSLLWLVQATISRTRLGLMISVTVAWAVTSSPKYTGLRNLMCNSTKIVPTPGITPPSTVEMIAAVRIPWATRRIGSSRSCSTRTGPVLGCS